MWCSVDAFVARRERKAVDKPLRLAWCVMILLMFGLAVRQGIWTGCSVALDVAHPYSGATALAKYIKAHGLTQTRIAGTHEWIANVLPYFSQNIFVNFPNKDGLSFVDWHASCHAVNASFTADGRLDVDCDVIIWPRQANSTAVSWCDQDIASIMPPKWRFIGHFPGRVIFEGQFIGRSGYAMFATKQITVWR